MAEATPVVLGLIKELRSHEVAIAELNHLSSSRVTLSTPLSFLLFTIILYHVWFYVSS